VWAGHIDFEMGLGNSLRKNCAGITGRTKCGHREYIQLVLVMNPLRKPPSQFRPRATSFPLHKCLKALSSLTSPTTEPCHQLLLSKLLKGLAFKERGAEERGNFKLVQLGKTPCI